MAQGGRIDYTIGFNVDKTGLNNLQKQLETIQKMSVKEVQAANPNLTDMNKARSALMKAQIAAHDLEQAMQKAFNTKLGVMNIEKLQSSLKQLNLNDIQQRFSAIGVKGQQAFLNVAKSALTTNVNLKQTSKIVDKIGTTLMNTLKWQFSSSLVNRFTGAIQQAYGYVQHLDSSLNDIRIVTGKSADEMERFAVQANKAAQRLGKTTTDYTEASLIYYQQGLRDEEVAARAETTLKAANVTGQSTAAVSEELTAVWNGYKIGTEQTEAAVDKLAAVAATTASDLQELSTGMSKVASAANAMGVDMDQLNAQIATIISVTRQAPESVGTALKTIYARLADLKLGDTDEEGLGLGDVSGTLDKVGIAVLDANGDLREMGDVIEEVAAKWNTWTSAQQTAIAQVMAGKRQYNNLVALFENWDMYSSALDTSRNSLGTLQEQQDTYMESVEAHIRQLKTEWEDLYDSILDEGFIKGAADGLKGILNIITNIVDGIGGGRTLLTGLLALIGTKFGRQISQIFTPFIENMRNAKINAAQLQTLLTNITEFEKRGDFGNKAAEAMRKAQQETATYWHLMTEGEINSSQEVIREIGAWTQKKEEILQAEEALKSYINTSEVQTLKNSIQGKTFLRGNTEGGDLLSDSAISEVNRRLIKDQDKTVGTLNSKYQEILKSIKSYNSEQASGIVNDEKRKKSLNSMTEALSGLQTGLKKTNKLGLVDEKKIRQAEQAVKNLKEKIEELKKPENRNASISDVLKEDLEVVGEVADITGAKFKVFFDVIKNGGNFEEAIAKIESYGKALEALQNKTALVVDSISKIVGGISSYVFALQSLTNIGSIWNNDDLETGEKILQLLSAFVIAIPMVTRGILNIATGIQTIATFRKQELIVQAAQNATSGVENAQDATKIGLKKILTKVILGEKAAEEGLAVATWAALGAFAAIAGIITVVSVISSNHQKSLEREAESTKRLAEQNQEYIDSLQETKSHLEELTNTYKNLQEQIDDHTISVEDARNQVYDLCKQYDLQDLAVKALIDDYNNLGAAIDDANKERQKELAKATAQQVDNQKAASKANIIANTKGSQRDFSGIDLKGGGVLGAVFGTHKPSEDALSDLGQKLGLDLDLDIGGHIDLENLMEAYARDENALWDIINSYDDSISQNLAKYLVEHRDDFDAYKEAVQTNQEQQAIVIANQTIDKENIKKVEEYQKAKEDLKKALADNFDSEEEVNDFVEKYLNGIDEIKEYAQQADIQEALQSSVGQGKERKVGFLPGLGKPQLMEEDARQNLINRIQEEGLTDIALGLSEDDWENYFLSGFNEDKIIEEIKNKQKIVFEKAVQDFNISTIPELNKNFATIMSDISSGESIDTSSEEYVQMQEDIRQAIEYNAEAFANLNGEVQTFFDESMVGTEQWIQSAYKLQQALDNIEFDTELQEYSNALDKALTDDKLKFQVDDSELQETLDEILNEDYDISVKIHSEAEEDFENIANALDKVDELAGKIGEDFIVAADDIRELNNAFPGILQGMEYMADGTIRLNEEVAKSAMDTAAQESASAVEATETRLKASAAELRAKAEIYEGMAAEARKAAEDSAYAETAKSNIVKDLMDIESKNNEAIENQKIDNANAVVDNSAVNAPILAENWDMAYQQATNAVNEWASVATEANAAVARGDKSWSQKGNFGHTFTGKSHTSSEGAQAAQLSAQSAEDIDWGSIANSYTNQATALRAQANDIEGMIATLGAKAVNTSAKTGGVGAKSGSGSGGSEKDPEHEEYLEREEDIYREINEQLEEIESTLGRIQTLNDHEWGYDAQKTLEEENKLLDQQVEKLQQKKKLQEGDLSYRRKQLELEGVQFSEDGSSMANAEAVLNGLYAHYNQMVDVYNAMSVAEQETYKATLEAEKDRIDKIEKKIDNYESLYSDYQSTLDEILDKHFEQIENTVKQFNNMVEVHLELSDAKKEWTDFWYDVVKDVEDNDFAEQISKSVDKLRVLIGAGARAIDSDVSVLTNHTLETIEEVQKQIASANEGGGLSIFGDDSALAKETLTDYRDKLMETLTSAKEEVDNISDAYLGMLDEAKEKLDDQVAGWEAIGDHIQHGIDLITLVSGEDSYDALNTQFEKQYKNNLELVEVQKMAKDEYAEQIEKYSELLKVTEKGSVEWKTYSAALERASENYKEAVKNLDSTVTKAIEDLYKWKQSQISEIEDAFDKGLSGNMGLSDLEDNWNLINDSASRYLDNVERALEMEGLENEFDKIINSTNLTAETQAKLNKMRDEELNKLSQRTKLSQYDIDEVKARLEITKQEMALEDARRNKSNLRLRRDSQGNYSYQYTSDDSQIDAAENGVLSAKKEWYQLVKSRNIDLVNEILNNRKELSAKFKELNETDWTNNEAGRQRLLDEIAKLQQREVELQADTEKAKQDLFSGTAVYFENVQNASMLPQWEATVTQLSDAWDNGGEGSFIGTVRAGIEKAGAIQEEFGAKTMNILQMAGIQYEDLRTKGIDPTIDALEELVGTNEELAQQLDETNTQLDQQEISLRKVEEAYNSLKSAAVEAIKSANDTLEQLAKTAIETQQQVRASVQASEEAARITSNSYNKRTSPSNSGGSGYNSGSTITTKMYKIETHPNGAYDTIAVYRKKGFSWEKWYLDGGLDTRRDDLKRRLSTKGITKDNTEGYTFRTGGYTGVWAGSNSVDDIRSGRLAILHEKELVLNQKDTKNLLDAVNVLRGISVDKISESIIAAARASTSVLNGVGTSLMQTVAGLTQNVQSGNMNNFSRNMTVNADFSGVKTADAIYQALMELDNYGMQESYSTAAHSNRAY